jgi:Mg2+/Co2+ transporter CorC
VEVLENRTIQTDWRLFKSSLSYSKETRVAGVNNQRNAVHGIIFAKDLLENQVAWTKSFMIIAI